MKFIETDDTIDLTFRRESAGGLVEIGVYRVMYGFRIRAGFVGRICCELDWCAGSDWSLVEMLYSICLRILEAREETKDCFDGIPSQSSVKPFFRDADFTMTVCSMCGDAKPIRLLRRELVR